MSSGDRTAVLKRSAVLVDGRWPSVVNAASAVATNNAYKTLQTTYLLNEDYEPVEPQRALITLPPYDLATLAPKYK